MNLCFAFKKPHHLIEHPSLEETSNESFPRQLLRRKADGTQSRRLFSGSGTGPVKSTPAMYNYVYLIVTTTFISCYYNS